MKVSYFATLRTVAGKSEEVWDRPAATLRDLMQDLVAEHGSEFARWVMKDGELSRLCIILIDGRDVRCLQGLDTPLTPESNVFIFPPLAGG